MCGCWLRRKDRDKSPLPFLGERSGCKPGRGDRAGSSNQSGSERSFGIPVSPLPRLRPRPLPQAGEVAVCGCLLRRKDRDKSPLPFLGERSGCKPGRGDRAGSSNQSGSEQSFGIPVSPLPRLRPRPLPQAGEVAGVTCRTGVGSKMKSMFGFGCS